MVKVYSLIIATFLVAVQECDATMLNKVLLPGLKKSQGYFVNRARWNSFRLTDCDTAIML